MRALPLTAGLLLLAVSLQAQYAPASHHESKTLTWGPAPAVFPKGAQMAVVSGDPTKAAPFTIELSLPDGYQLKPHSHPTAEAVTVVKGTFLVGMGDVFDLSKTQPMKPGDTGKLPAGHHHYATAKGATIVSVSSMGPFGMTYVNPADDPSK